MHLVYFTAWADDNGRIRTYSDIYGHEKRITQALQGKWSEINVGRKRFPVTARIVGPDDADYTRLFTIADENNSGRYTAYQEKTTRPIAVVALTPKS